MNKVIHLLSCACSVAALSCSGDDPGHSNEFEYPETPAVSWVNFLAYAEQHSRVVDGERIYIVEWDIPVREQDLHDYYLSRFVEIPRSGLGFKSTLDQTSTGADNVWPDRKQLNLTYCVSDDFGEYAARMRQEMRLATWAWSRSANVRFTYLSAHDDDCNDANTAVEIPVVPISDGGACAFFPIQDGQTSCTDSGRAVVVDVADIDTWPTTPVNGTLYPNVGTLGTLRHELGHTLGLRHEHIREADNAIGACVNEVNNPGAFRALTAYDKNSAMHYPWCDGTVTSAQEVTLEDLRGVTRLYGAAAWVPAML
jgi:hypothetical protein